MNDLFQTRQMNERGLWSGCVNRRFEKLNLHTRPAAQEIAESLAVFCQQNDRIQDHTLSLLMARSFFVSGDPDAAEAVLKNDRIHRSHADSWLGVLSADYPFPELYPLFSSRILRPQYLASTGALWILDFEKMERSEADRHELILFQTIRTLIETVSCVWKNTGGKGTLGITGLSRLTHFVRGRPSPPRLLNPVRDVLALRAKKNGWPSAPVVLLLDSGKKG